MSSGFYKDWNSRENPDGATHASAQVIRMTGPADSFGTGLYRRATFTLWHPPSNLTAAKPEFALPTEGGKEVRVPTAETQKSSGGRPLRTTKTLE